MAKNKLSPYANTPLTDMGYLDIYAPQPVPVGANDVLYEILPAYTYRPDLLAFDLYGEKELWWVFAQRNMDIIEDPVYDLEPGVTIYLPQADKLKEVLGE